MGYRLSRPAERDIATIYVEGVREFGLRQADVYHDRLEAVFTNLADNPRLAQERHEITPPARVFPVGVHVVIYEVDEEDNVLILRVRRASEDWING